MKQLKTVIAVMLLFAPVGVQGQDCASGALLTQQAYQYGRFETRMQSAQGGGVSAASYVMFSRGFCRKLLELGYQDGMAQKEAILDFFEEK